MARMLNCEVGYLVSARDCVNVVRSFLFLTLHFSVEKFLPHLSF